MNRGKFKGLLLLGAISVTALAQQDNAVNRYPVGAGMREIIAPFCVSRGPTAGGPTHVRVWAPGQPRGHSGRGGGIQMTTVVDLKAGSLVDARGTTVSTLAISGNSGTVTAMLAPGCYSVHISATGVGPVGGWIDVQAASVASPTPRPASRPAPPGDDS